MDSEDTFLNQQVNEILESSSEIKKRGLNRRMIELCLKKLCHVHRGDLEWTISSIAQGIAKETPDYTQELVEDIASDIRRYYNYCNIKGYL